MTSILKKLTCLFFLSLLSLSSLFAQYPFGKLEGQVVAVVPNGSGTAFADLDPLVTFHFSANSSHTTTLSDSVKLLWLFSDGTYSLERNPNHPFDQTINNQDIDAYLKSTTRYKPSDPIRFEVPSRAGDSYQRVKVDTLNGANILLQSSWQPISGDTIYYIITIENNAQQCEKQPIDGLVRFSYPSDTLQVLEEIIYQNRFQPQNAVYPTNNSPLEYSFSNMPYQDQWYLIVKALVVDGLALGEQYGVEATLEMGAVNQNTGEANYRCGSDSDNVLNSTTTRPRDPNNKVVSQEVIYANQGQQELLFTINFQNIKGGDASKVKIVDYFDFAHLDTAGFEIVAQSHAMNYTWNANELEFQFDRINLPSVEAEKQKSAPNIGATKGFVSYKVSVKTPYQVGDIIENQALVNFFHVSDALNPADQVLTNKTTTLVKALSPCPSECTTDCGTFNCFCTIILILSVVILLLLLLIFVRKLR